MKLKIAYQGVAGAYSHIAAKTVYPDALYIPCDTFEQAMDKVQNGEVDFAMIPIENSNAGRVTDVHFLLPKTGLFVVGEFLLPVHHQLLVLPDADLNDVKVVMSHPQALAQCSAFLRRNNIKAEARIDTAKSCEFVLEYHDKSRAAIASSLAAEIYGLKIASTNIENAANNTTRFLIMAKKPSLPEYDGDDFITSFIFKAKNIPAALYKALGGFATNGINLIKIESYLEEGTFVSAQFYVEVEAHPSQVGFKNAMEELNFFAENVHMLGTYCRWKR